MHIDRWFKVLVLGGVAQACAISDAPTDTGSDGSGAAPVGGSNGEAAQAPQPQGSGGGSDNGTGGNSNEGGTNAGGNSGEGGNSGAGGSGLNCSPTPDPGDACGCPCCWVAGCLNTETCCGSFCSLGNNGAGCCE